jgi:hypothetical protein
MLLCMRTTVDLPDDLLVAAKKKAAELRVPLRGLIEEGLRERLKTPNKRNKKPVTIRWVAVKGDISADLNLSDREYMHYWLRRSTT